jgi:hypothetical protein
MQLLTIQFPYQKMEIFELRSPVVLLPVSAIGGMLGVECTVKVLVDEHCSVS